MLFWLSYCLIGGRSCNWTGYIVMKITFMPGDIMIILAALGTLGGKTRRQSLKEKIMFQSSICSSATCYV